MKYILILLFFVNIYANDKTYSKEELINLIPNDFSIVNKLEDDITNDKLKDVIWSIESKKTFNAENYLYIFENIGNKKYKLIYDKKNILPTYKVAEGSVSSYSLSVKDKKLIISLIAPVRNVSSIYFFDFYFQYINNTKKFKLIDSIYREINNCDHDDIGRYEIVSSSTTNKYLDDFNSDLFFAAIYKQWQIDNKNIMKKIKTKQVLDTYKTSLTLYKSKNYKKLKLYVDDYIIRYTDKKCSPRSYMTEYLFLDNDKDINMTNDIAFFLEQTKNYDEAIYLLEKILEKYPNRTVAYINLGDAYWGLANKEKAKQAYSTYIKQMKEKGKERKIPKVVLERIK
ncbi:tetratricopeptide repeat protein [Sulfurimonas sp.]|uniref:tetratricopeptide repeat protein n=1 Tax=Sulfurimonas sp. TaxID=2022749 RepID=UPI002B4A60BC|nr:tetratricopeptide repeat protein [Sulfurimonas sp.]